MKPFVFKAASRLCALGGWLSLSRISLGVTRTGGRALDLSHGLLTSAFLGTGLVLAWIYCRRMKESFPSRYPVGKIALATLLVPGLQWIAAQTAHSFFRYPLAAWEWQILAALLAAVGIHISIVICMTPEETEEARRA